MLNDVSNTPLPEKLLPPKIYDKMVARWSGETPDEIKEQYGMWPIARRLENDFQLMLDIQEKVANVQETAVQAG